MTWRIWLVKPRVEFAKRASAQLSMVCFLFMEVLQCHVHTTRCLPAVIILWSYFCEPRCCLLSVSCVHNLMVSAYCLYHINPHINRPSEESKFMTFRILNSDWTEIWITLHIVLFTLLVANHKRWLIYLLPALQLSLNPLTCKLSTFAAIWLEFGSTRFRKHHAESNSMISTGTASG